MLGFDKGGVVVFVKVLKQLAIGVNVVGTLMSQVVVSVGKPASAWPNPPSPLKITP